MATAEFPSKAHSMVSDPDHQDVVGWTHGGMAFSVKKLTEFCNILLPKYFKHNNYSSFVRQLNMYNFKKVGEPGSNTFQHPYFQRDNLDLLPQVTRKKRRENEPDEAAEAELAGLKRQRDHMNEELARLKMELATQTSKQMARHESMQEENTRLWNEVSRAREEHQAMETTGEVVMAFLSFLLQGKQGVEAALMAGINKLNMQALEQAGLFGSQGSFALGAEMDQAMVTGGTYYPAATSAGTPAGYHNGVNKAHPMQSAFVSEETSHMRVPGDAMQYNTGTVVEPGSPTIHYPDDDDDDGMIHPLPVGPAAHFQMVSSPTAPQSRPYAVPLDVPVSVSISQPAAAAATAAVPRVIPPVPGAAPQPHVITGIPLSPSVQAGFKEDPINLNGGAMPVRDLPQWDRPLSPGAVDEGYLTFNSDDVMNPAELFSLTQDTPPASKRQRVDDGTQPLPAYIGRQETPKFDRQQLMELAVQPGQDGEQNNVMNLTRQLLQGISDILQARGHARLDGTLINNIVTGRTGDPQQPLDTLMQMIGWVAGFLKQ